MPAQLSRGDRRLLMASAAVFVAMVAITLAVAQNRDDSQDDPSSSSTGSMGAKAAYLLLQAYGYRTERWDLPPSELTDPSGTTLIFAEPTATPTPAEQKAIEVFVSHGGQVIATGINGAVMLSHFAIAAPVPGRVWSSHSSTTPSAVGRAAPSITLAQNATWDSDQPALPLYGAGDSAVVVQVPIAGGAAFWWAASTPLTNAGISAPGNLEFLLASLGPAAGRRVLFDEYFHGARRSLAGTLLATPAKWLVVQLAIFMSVILLAYSRRSGPVMPLRVESRLSPLEFVRTLGSLYRRAGSAPIAVDIAARRFRFALTRRLGVAGNAPAAALARAAAARGAIDEDELAAAIRGAESARDAATLEPRTALKLIQAVDRQARLLKLFRASDKERQ